MVFTILAKPAQNGAMVLYAVLLGVTCLGCGLYIMLATEASVIFDLHSRRIVRRLTIASYRLRRDFSLADVASIGVKEFYSNGYSYAPVLTLRNGETRWLTPGLHCGQLTAANIAAELCAATGLDRRDIPRRKWW